VRKLLKFVLLLLALCLGIPQLFASVCASVYGRIVRAPNGRLISKDGKPISNAEIEVTDRSDEVVFETKTQGDGTFRINAEPAKYRVRVSADGYIDFLYYVDLRSQDRTQRFDVPLEASSSCGDMRVIDDEEEKMQQLCAAESTPSNLSLKVPTILSGRLVDQTGAAFKNSDVRLVRLSEWEAMQPHDLYSKTDVEGKFTFDEAESGEYRLLASPNRGFVQPDKLDCYEQPECKLEIVLKVNPTDLPYAACPIK
jgi:hypothetical protein